MLQFICRHFVRQLGNKGSGFEEGFVRDGRVGLDRCLCLVLIELAATYRSLLGQVRLKG